LERRSLDARRLAEGAAEHYRRQLEQQPNVADFRLGWALAEQIAGNHEKAVQVLEAGIGSSNPGPFREALATVYLNWLNLRTQSGNASLGWQLGLLNRALQHVPRDPRLLTQLAKLALRDWERSDEAYTRLKELVAEGVAPAVVHLVLGTQALKKGELNEAKLHLLLANDRNPNMPVILNNLAWTLVHEDEPDLQRALQLAQAAKRMSEHPEIYDTLGTILARMGRHREAIQELETALRAFPARPELHLRLADLYEQLGENELAAIHRRMAKSDRADP
jgi:tetratricopeptide (TPR) repeat protein